jgi:cell division septum initiation protein DivIVA
MDASKAWNKPAQHADSPSSDRTSCHHIVAESLDSFDTDSDTSSNCVTLPSITSAELNEEHTCDEFEALNRTLFTIHSRQVTREAFSRQVTKDGSELQRELEDARTQVAELRAQQAAKDIVMLAHLQELKRENESLKLGIKMQSHPLPKGSDEMTTSRWKSANDAHWIRQLCPQCEILLVKNNTLENQTRLLRNQNDDLVSSSRLLKSQNTMQDRSLRFASAEKKASERELETMKASRDSIYRDYRALLKEHEDLLGENESLCSQSYSMSKTSSRITPNSISSKSSGAFGMGMSSRLHQEPRQKYVDPMCTESPCCDQELELLACQLY